MAVALDVERAWALLRLTKALLHPDRSEALQQVCAALCWSIMDVSQAYRLALDYLIQQGCLDLCVQCGSYHLRGYDGRCDDPDARY